MSNLTDQEIELIARRVAADLAGRGRASAQPSPTTSSPAAELGIFDSIDEAVRAASAQALSEIGPSVVPALLRPKRI